jgi:hypothetical protein
VSETRSNNTTEWPELSPWLTLTAAIVWGSTRDEGLTMAAMHDSVIAAEPHLSPLKQLSPRKLDLHRKRLIAENPALQVRPSPVEAGKKLLQKFCSGRLAVYRSLGAHDPMPPMGWVGVRLSIGRDDFDFFSVGKLVARGWYIWLQREEVLQLWPPLSAQTAATPVPQARLATSDLLDERPVTAGDSPTSADVSEQELCAYFKHRMEIHPPEESWPNTQEDLKRAQRHFEGRPISRDAFREIRKKVLPPDWLKPGRGRKPRR